MTITTYSKKESIDALLHEANKQRDDIINLYNTAIKDQKISPQFSLQIRSYFGNLKSSLDYSTQSLVKSNFPIRRTLKDFRKSTRMFPTKLRDIIQKWQPFNDNDWIGIMNEINNKNKHIDLIPQKIVEDVEVSVRHPSEGEVTWTGDVTFGEGVEIMGVPIDPKTQLPIENDKVKTTKTIWKGIRFDTKDFKSIPSNVDVLWLTQRSFKDVCQIIVEIESI